MAAYPIRVGIVGAGNNTIQRHIPGLLQQEGVEIVSVVNRTNASSQRVADQFDIPNVYDDWRELVTAPDSNAIVIGTWPYLHKPATVMALEAGKHVLCEARMALNLSEARAMYEAARERPHLVAQLVPSPATLEVDAFVASLLAQDALGKLLVVEVRDQRGFVDDEVPLHWRENLDLSGFNVMSLGIWYETLLRWIGEAIQVVASGKNFVRMRIDPSSGKWSTAAVPDHLTVAASMACGAHATFLLSRVTGHAPPTALTLYGSEATLRFQEGQLFFGGRGEADLQPLAVPVAMRGGWRVEEAFVNGIRGRETVSDTTFETGLKYMAFTEAVARSLAEERAISVSFESLRSR